MTNTADSQGTDYAILVRSDGSVVYATHRSGYGSTYTPSPPAPGERCRLAPASSFDACLVAVSDRSGLSGPSGNKIWECMFYMSGWFESCETESPFRCE
jgi:hypothetical protein